MEKYLEITKVQLRHHAWQHLLISVFLLAASPLILGISNLDEAQSAKVLETYVALIGIVLFVPVFLPEQDKEVRELVKSKYTDSATVYIIRILLGAVFSVVLVLAYIGIMKAGNCEFPVMKFFFGTMAEVAAFGGLGILAYGISQNLIIGYMAPIGYYVAALGAGARYLKIFYPFGMLSDYNTKYWLTAGGILLAAAGILLFRRKR